MNSADQPKSRKAIAVPLNEDTRSTLVQQKGQHPEYGFTYRGNPVDHTERNKFV